MRKIKFRAYDTYTKIMLSVVDIIKFTKSEGIYITRDSAYGVGINIQYQPHIELMQYTGLKDKNGVEIFEGDIVRYDDCLWEIEYLEKYGMFILNDKDILENFINTDSKWVEIVGNIFENPELLKGGQE